MASLNKSLELIHQQLSELGLTIATAESATGGWIAKLLTDHSGSSKYFKGGVVVYSNAVKRKILRVPVSDGQSAVSRKVAVAMAKNTLKLFDVDVSVAITGYMEPNAALKKKHRTGYFFVSVATRRGASTKVRCGEFYLEGTRRQNRLSASTSALHLVIKSIRDFVPGSKKSRT